jgi:hypothetical protein
MSTTGELPPLTTSFGTMNVKNVKMKTAPTRFDTANAASTRRAHSLPMAGSRSSDIAKRYAAATLPLQDRPPVISHSRS